MPTSLTTSTCRADLSSTRIRHRRTRSVSRGIRGEGLPVDVALGKIDSLDINGSYEGTVPLWYRLLNCGFRLPASAGTDVFLNRLRGRLPGGDRAYVRLDGAFSDDAWVKSLKAGRSFVTNGPMFELTANGKFLGETITLSAPGEVKIQRAQSRRRRYPR